MVQKLFNLFWMEFCAACFHVIKRNTVAKHLLPGFTGRIGFHIKPNAYGDIAPWFGAIGPDTLLRFVIIGPGVTSFQHGDEDGAIAIVGLPVFWIV